MNDIAPIFVHASPRGGSTFFFHTLRGINSLICFNEVISDGLADTTKQALVRAKKRADWDFNHGFLLENDRAEIVAAWEWFKPYAPVRPAFRDFLPASGVLPAYLRGYLDSFIGYARVIGKRPVFCEVYSRGRAGALRGAFGGYHIAQFRDPISQFGSLYRALEEGGLWAYLCAPILEIGVNGNAGLFSLIPKAWRLPAHAWTQSGSADAWLSYTNYKLLVASPRPNAVELAFRTHLLSWFLTNIAALCFSDLALDIDMLNDDLSYRADTARALNAGIGAAPDLSNVRKFTRYLQFEAFDLCSVADEVAHFIAAVRDDGRLESAIRGLGTLEQLRPARTSADLLIAKLDASLKAMATAPRRHISNGDWASLVAKHRVIWENDNLKTIMWLLYPAAAPVVQAIRKVANLV